MLSITEKQNCCGCGACANVCPVRCISMQEDEEGFLYPRADASRCVDCGLCSSVCVCQQEGPLRQREPVCYAAAAKNASLRAASSSGGVFSLLAENVLASGGVVYGVTMDADMGSCSFARITDVSGLRGLRGSKYLQAKVGETYRSVKQDLEDGREVLFSGVPCQIDALKLFLDRDYENLCCVEVICHGTPSPLLWKKYVEYLETKHRGKIREVRFRNKKSGWRKYSLAIDGADFHQTQTVSEDPYLMMFSRNFSLRLSCYDCAAKKLESAADLTLGDFWAIWNLLPELDDDKGTSLVMVRSDRGAALFQRIQGEIDLRETPFAAAVAANGSYNHSAPLPGERDGFFEDLHTISFEEMIRKYCALSAKAKLKKTALYRALRKVFR